MSKLIYRLTKVTIFTSSTYIRFRKCSRIEISQEAIQANLADELRKNSKGRFFFKFIWLQSFGCFRRQCVCCLHHLWFCGFIHGDMICTATPWKKMPISCGIKWRRHLREIFSVAPVFNEQATQELPNIWSTPFQLLKYQTDVQRYMYKHSSLLRPYIGDTSALATKSLV